MSRDQDAQPRPGHALLPRLPHAVSPRPPGLAAIRAFYRRQPWSSFKALARRPGLRVSFPEAEWRQQFAENADGSVGQSLMNVTIRQAITVDASVKPNYAGIRVPVLAIYQAQRPFEEVAAEYDIRNEQERAALRQQYTAVRNMYTRWQRDLLAAIPTARIVELVGANLFMFLSNEADVLREIRAFAATVPK